MTYGMNKDIKQYPIYRIYNGEFVRVYNIESTNDYNHNDTCLHHYIPKGSYKRNFDWYVLHGIEQKLLWITNSMHEQIHQATGQNNLTDEQFENRYKISRWKCIFNKKHSQY